MHTRLPRVVDSGEATPIERLRAGVEAAFGRSASVGCDVVDVARLAGLIRRRPTVLTRIFTERERHDAQRGGVTLDSHVGHARLAARFAAKEAARKALGDLHLSFHATEVRSDADGAPQLWLRGQRADASLSLSHDAGIAIAVVVTASAEPRHDAVASPTGPTRDVVAAWRDPLGIDEPPLPPSFAALPGMPALAESCVPRPARAAVSGLLERIA